MKKFVIPGALALLLFGNEAISLAVFSVWACLGLAKLFQAMAEGGVFD